MMDMQHWLWGFGFFLFSVWMHLRHGLEFSWDLAWAGVGRCGTA